MLKRHLTYANVMATLGVFLALGGVSYAAIKLPGNSVGAKQIKSNAVTSSEVKNRSLKGGDFARGQLPQGAKGDRGPAGPPAAKFWAQISAGLNPTVSASSGDVTVTRDAANNAREVTFPGNVSKCALMVTRVAGPPGSTARVISRPTGASVRVWTTIVDGGNATTRTDAFDIAAFC